MYIYLRIFHNLEKHVIQQATLLLVIKPGPKARRIAGCHVDGERAPSRAQMLQQSTVSKFFDIMEKSLLEQG